MLSKMEAVIEAGILPDVFRSICEIIKIDPDQKYFNIVEINQIKEYAGVRSKPIEKILSGYTAEECAEMLGVKVSSFRSNYAPSLEKIRRGVFKKESVHSLMAQLGKEDEVIQMEEKPVTYEKPKEIKTITKQYKSKYFFMLACR